MPIAVCPKCEEDAEIQRCGCASCDYCGELVDAQGGCGLGAGAGLPALPTKPCEQETD